MDKKYRFNKFRVLYKFWIEDDDYSIILNHEIMELLINIGKYKSLSSSAKEVGVSYRKAWGDIKNAEEKLGVKLMKRMRGGSSGGASILTPDAQKIILAWENFQNQIDNSISNLIIDFKKFVKY